MPAEASGLTAAELKEAWPVLDEDERWSGFTLLPRSEAEDLFLSLPTADQAQLILQMAALDRRSWLRLLPPDEIADLIQHAAEEDRPGLLSLLDFTSRNEVLGLMAYADDDAGGLMTPHYARLRPEMTVAEAIAYLRRYAREHRDSTYYAYVLDQDQHLLGTLSFRELFGGNPNQPVGEIMRTDVIKVTEDQDQESVSQIFATHHLLALPVVNDDNQMRGIVTIDDIVDVVQEEATEDIQKIGGSAALDAPYLAVGLAEMTRKRGAWLTVLFVGEMLTASAMTFFEDEIAKAVVLALFVPLIISSGGNSGSQASTLVIRAMALGELRLTDWWRVMRREVASGLALGTLLAVIGFLRVVAWQGMFGTYGEHYLFIGATVSLSLVGVVTFGTIAGSMLPFVLRHLGFDPASASTPFVATLVDVTGLIIYFTAASALLTGRLL